METITGTIKYENLEGGVWRLFADDGRRLTLLDLDEEFLQDGLRVRLEGSEEAAFGFAMMGKSFVVKKAEKI